jgi:hypothetical protein
MHIKLIFTGKIFIIYLLWRLFIPLPFVFSQNEEHVYGDCFIKRIEYNFIDAQLAKTVGDELIITGYLCNVSSKSDVEKLFFGDFNARIEFFYAPSFEVSSKGEAGFRIMRDSLDTSWILEVKHIPNYEEVFGGCNDKYSITGISADAIHSRPLDSMSSRELIWKQMDERLKLFKVETWSFPVGDQFAEKLYRKMISFISNFKAKGRLAMSTDGYTVTFRNVVDDELWSLEIHEPKSSAHKLSDLCRQIITDSQTGKLDEHMYISVLDGFDF